VPAVPDQRCPAPCVYSVSQEDTGARSTRSPSSGGKADELTTQLEGRMKDASQKLEYERAAQVRDQLHAIDRSLRSSAPCWGTCSTRRARLLTAKGPRSRSTCSSSATAASPGSQLRVQPAGVPTEELLSSFSISITSRGLSSPRSCCCPSTWPTPGRARSGFRRRKGKGARPRAGAAGRRCAVEMAMENARQSLRGEGPDAEEPARGLTALQSRLRFAAPSPRIECFDISTFQGQLTVGSQVLFTDGEPDKSGYRLFKVRGEAAGDDFASMFQVLTRRLKRGIEEQDLPESPGDRRGKRPAQRRPGGAEGSGVEPSGSAACRAGERPGAGGRGALRRAPGLPRRRKRGRSGRAEPEVRRSRRARRRRARPPRRPGGGDRDRRADSRTARWSGARSASSSRDRRILWYSARTPASCTCSRACATRRTGCHTFHRKLRRERNFRSVLEEIPGIAQAQARASQPFRIAQAHPGCHARGDRAGGSFNLQLAERVQRFLAASPRKWRPQEAAEGGAELDGGALPQADPETARCCATAMTSPLTPRRQNWTRWKRKTRGARAESKPNHVVRSVLHALFFLASLADTCPTRSSLAVQYRKDREGMKLYRRSSRHRPRRHRIADGGRRYRGRDDAGRGCRDGHGGHPQEYLASEERVNQATRKALERRDMTIRASTRSSARCGRARLQDGRRRNRLHHQPDDRVLLISRNIEGSLRRGPHQSGARSTRSSRNTWTWTRTSTARRAPASSISRKAPRPGSRVPENGRADPSQQRPGVALYLFAARRIPGAAMSCARDRLPLDLPDGDQRQAPLVVAQPDEGGALAFASSRRTPHPDRTQGTVHGYRWSPSPGSGR